MGMGFGLMLGPMVSATLMSPLLGGWRHVLYFYGGLSAVVGSLWFVFGREPRAIESDGTHAHAMPIRQALSSLVRNRTVWLVGLTLMFRMAGIQGMTGYLPLYLRDQGWDPAAADNTLSVFYGVSTLAVIPLAALSDKIGLRKAILFLGLIVTALSLALLPYAPDNMVWLCMVLSGVFMDGFMSITIVLLLESEGVGVAYSGAALGIVFTIAQIGGVIAPPLGNAFADVSPGAPFVFWAALSAVALVALAFIRETGRRKTRAISRQLSETTGG
jgi:cyanate permease